MHVQPIFTSICIQCHSPAAPGGSAQGMDLSAGMARTNLMARAQECNPPANAARNRVVPGMANESYLVWKILGMNPLTNGPLCGGQRMPRSGPPFLDNTQIETIRRWIDQGALDN
jgi:hypothetical protein